MKPYRVLRSNEKRYRLLHNADVAVDKRTDTLVIVRCSNMFPFNEFDGIPSRPLHEASVLRKLRHPNIIRLLEADISRNKFYRVYEYMDSDLLAFLRSRAFNGALLSAEHQKSLISQVLRAVDYSHSHGIIHRNLCLRNCLVDDKGTTVKITGFNLSRSYAPPMRQFSHEITRLWYRAPEVLLGQEVYTPKVDMWSVGVIVAEIFRAGDSLFPGDCEIDTLFRIFRTLGTPTETTWPGVTKLQDYTDRFPMWPAQNLQKICPNAEPLGLNLLERVLVCNPAQRWTAKQALQQHLYLLPPSKETAQDEDTATITTPTKPPRLVVPRKRFKRSDAVTSDASTVTA